jgi:hypothetical protein
MLENAQAMFELFSSWAKRWRYKHRYRTHDLNSKPISPSEEIEIVEEKLLNDYNELLGINEDKG